MPIILTKASEVLLFYMTPWCSLTLKNFSEASLAFDSSIIFDHLACNSAGKIVHLLVLSTYPIRPDHTIEAGVDRVFLDSHSLNSGILQGLDFPLHSSS